MRVFGLIGYPLSHSFSQKYFSEKFIRENITDAIYKLYPLKKVEDTFSLINNTPELTGLNVTIPYKLQVIPYIDELDETAIAVGAVNCILIKRDKGQGARDEGQGTRDEGQGTRDKGQGARGEGKETSEEGTRGKNLKSQISNLRYVYLKGFNTDVYGFSQSIKPFLESQHQRALILGTGGGAKAVEFALKQIGIETYNVSRQKEKNEKNKFTWKELNKNIIDSFPLIINTTPLGMYPNVNEFPPLPYEYLSSKHFLYDLVYNPKETIFLKQGRSKGSLTMNGLNMLQLQADKSWEIWNKD